MKGASSRRAGILSCAAGVIVMCSATACAPPSQRPPAPVPAPVPAPLVIADLPTVPVQIVTDSVPVARPNQGGRITLTSTNADLRDLLPLLASAAGVNLVMGPEVRGSVSVRFQNVRAIDALNAVIEQSGLVIGNPALEAPWAKPVFYDLPVNVNMASAATMRARFDITQRLADWIVKGRTF